jgi:hypothetical protein
MQRNFGVFGDNNVRAEYPCSGADCDAAASPSTSAHANGGSNSRGEGDAAVERGGAGAASRDVVANDPTRRGRGRRAAHEHRDVGEDQGSTRSRWHRIFTAVAAIKRWRAGGPDQAELTTFKYTELTIFKYKWGGPPKLMNGDVVNRTCRTEARASGGWSSLG